MKSKLLQSLLLVLAGLLINTGCKKGCKDLDALNYDYSADENDGNCQYSKAIFYMSAVPPPGNPPFTVYINGNSQGQVTGIYPSGPANCSASGCVSYQFLSGNSVDWELRDGSSFVINTGMLSTSTIESCIVVQMY